MCGRFVGYRDLEALRAHFSIDRVEADLSPNYNTAPSQTIPVIVRLDGENVLKAFRWGLVPFWAKDPSIGSRMINARSDAGHSGPESLQRLAGRQYARGCVEGHPDPPHQPRIRFPPGVQSREQGRKQFSGSDQKDKLGECPPRDGRFWFLVPPHSAGFHA